jgi:hypothetical protein
MLFFWVVTPRCLVGDSNFKQCVSSKHWYLPTSLHGVIIRNNNFVILTAVRTSDLMLTAILNVWVPQRSRGATRDSLILSNKI